MSALPELPVMEDLYEIRKTRGDFCTITNAQAYGDARAAHARKAALEETVAELDGMTCNNATARSAIKLCIEAIKELK